MEHALRDEFNLNSELKAIFGFSGFKENQEGIIEAVLGGSDVFASMPTGGGKSLCYQLPAHILPGTCIVISPLIALMKDQVDAARAIGLRAQYLNSTLSPMEVSQVFHDLAVGEVDLLYVAPERFVMPNFIPSLRSTKVSMFAIDEAHCISEWGHDFRPDYLALSMIVDSFPNIPVTAFTASATNKVQDDIIVKLGLREPYIIRASFNRPELFYQVVMKDGLDMQLLSFIKGKAGEPGIVYRTTRKNVEDTAEFLSMNGVNALPYHAGLSNELRRKNQEMFNRDEVDVIVATIAFGMGIDKSNIRFVIHGDLPKNMESYYQETGRSGRDGEPAECVLFFGRGDIPKIRYFIDMMEDSRERDVASGKLSGMVKYASVNACRRKQILNYFNEEYHEENCGACDICTENVQKVDATTDAQIIMSAILRTGQRFGAMHIVDVVAGADTKKIRSFRHNEIKTYGAGKDKDKKYWRRMLDELIGQGCLTQSSGSYPTLVLAEKGFSVLNGKESFQAIDYKEEKAKRAGNSFLEYNEELFGKLKLLRKQLAGEKNVPPYIIFSDRTLHEMSSFFPVDKTMMISINGVGERKLEEYGDAFMNEIKSFREVNPEIKPLLPDVSVKTDTTVKKKKKVSETRETTWEMLQDGKKYSEIADERKLTLSTIANHIDLLIREGRDIDMDFHVGAEKCKEITEMFLSMKTGSLRAIVDASGGNISFEEARMVRAVVETSKAS